MTAITLIPDQCIGGSDPEDSDSGGYNVGGPREEGGGGE